MLVLMISLLAAPASSPAEPFFRRISVGAAATNPEHWGKLVETCGFSLPRSQADEEALLTDTTADGVDHWIYVADDPKRIGTGKNVCVRGALLRRDRLTYDDVVREKRSFSRIIHAPHPGFALYPCSSAESCARLLRTRPEKSFSE